MTDSPARFFDAIASRYDRVYAIPSRDSAVRMDRVLSRLPAAPAHIVDLGVGTGRELPALLDAGHRPTGVDVSAAMLERCSRRARPVPLVQADFWTPPLPFEDGSFDAAIALHGTLAHPPDAAAVSRLMRELGRVVATGGRFVAEVPSLAWLDHATDDGGRRDDGRPARIVRTGPRTCTYEDLDVGVSIAARLLDEGEWLAALAPLWRGRIEPMGPSEWLVVADRV